MSTGTKTQTRRLVLLAGLAVVAAIASLGLGALSDARATSAQPVVVERARFTADGEVIRPEDWRSWTFVGTPLTPNALNGGEAPFPEFHNVYIEPSAFEVYKRTGEFPEGTQLAKELVSVISQDAHEDGSTTQASGRGYFQAEFQGLELAIKEQDRFPNEPGGWAYFSFGHQPEPYAETATAFPTATCNGCHEASAAKDWVFTQFYPVLRGVRSEMSSSSR